MQVGAFFLTLLISQVSALSIQIYKHSRYTVLLISINPIWRLPNFQNILLCRICKASKSKENVSIQAIRGKEKAASVNDSEKKTGHPNKNLPKPKVSQSHKKRKAVRAASKPALESGTNHPSQKAGRKFRVNTDGAIRPDASASGLAAIVRDEQGKIRYWWQKRAGGMTCNEAEYAAVIFALERMLRIQGRGRTLEVVLYCDSRLVVDQMQGRAAAHAPALRLAQARLKTLASRFRLVSFQHIAREQNRLADALAYEALAGWDTHKPKATNGEPHEEVVEEFFSSWRSS